LFRSLDACPIVFLYRHAIELYLKSIILGGTRISRYRNLPSPCKTEVLNGHKLDDLLSCVTNVLRSVWQGRTEGIGSYSEFEGIIRDFNDADPQSFAFRYPVDKKGQGSLADNFSFNIRVFAERLEPILVFLSTVNTAIDCEIDRWYEEHAETAQYPDQSIEGEFDEASDDHSDRTE
jgi:hypothetical protein